MSGVSPDQSVAEDLHRSVSFTNRTFPAFKMPAYSLLECGRKLDWIPDNGKIAENNGAFEQSPEKSLSSRQEDGGKRYFRQRTEGAETRTMKTWCRWTAKTLVCKGQYFIAD